MRIGVAEFALDLGNPFDAKLGEPQRMGMACGDGAGSDGAANSDQQRRSEEWTRQDEDQTVESGSRICGGL